MKILSPPSPPPLLYVTDKTTSPTEISGFFYKKISTVYMRHRWPTLCPEDGGTQRLSRPALQGEFGPRLTCYFSLVKDRMNNGLNICLC